MYTITVVVVSLLTGQPLDTLTRTEPFATKEACEAQMPIDRENMMKVLTPQVPGGIELRDMQCVLVGGRET